MRKRLARLPQTERKRKDRKDGKDLGVSRRDIRRPSSVQGHEQSLAKVVRVTDSTCDFIRSYDL
jgi:hypothetical protein